MHSFSNDGLRANVQRSSATKTENHAHARRLSIESLFSGASPKMSLRSATMDGFFNKKRSSGGVAISDSITEKAHLSVPPTVLPADPRAKFRGATEGDFFGNKKGAGITKSKTPLRLRDTSRNRFKNLSTATALSGDMDYAEGTSVTGLSTWMVSVDTMTQESLDQGSDSEDDLDYDSDDDDDDGPLFFECKFPNPEENPNIRLPLSLAQRIPILNAFWVKSNGSSTTDENKVLMDMADAGVSREEIFRLIFAEESQVIHPSLPGLSTIAEERLSSASVYNSTPLRGGDGVSASVSCNSGDDGGLSRAWI